MGKLINALNKQLSDVRLKEDAEDCIKIYNWIKETDKDGRVWSSRWQPLVYTKFYGLGSTRRTYQLTFMGRAVLKGLTTKE